MIHLISALLVAILLWRMYEMPVLGIRSLVSWIVQILVSEYFLGLAVIFAVAAGLAFSQGDFLNSLAGLIWIWNFGHCIAEGIRFEAIATRGEQVLPLSLSWIKTLWSPLRVSKRQPWKFRFHDRLLSGETLGDITSETPLVVVLHGGSWTFGDAAQMPLIPTSFHRDGYSVISLNYRKISEHAWPAALEDVRESLREILRHRPPTAPVFLFGRSAGGHLALLAGREFPGRITGVVALYPPTELISMYENGLENDILHTRPLLRKLIGGPPTEKAAEYRKSSPAMDIPAGFPPTIIAYADRDPLVPPQQGEVMVRALQKAGAEVTALRLPRASHCFDGHWNGLSSQALRHLMASFFDRLTPPSQN